jgi:hypothetical protein
MSYGIGKCVTCVSEAKDSGEPIVVENLRDAVVLVPSWQTTVMFGQSVMACIPLGSCVEHLVQNESSKITGNGILIPASGGVQ